MMDKREYEDAMRSFDGGPTPSIDLFIKMQEYDDNTIWRLELGHIANLLEEAIERMQAAENRLRET